MVLVTDLAAATICPNSWTDTDIKVDQSIYPASASEIVKLESRWEDQKAFNIAQLELYTNSNMKG